MKKSVLILSFLLLHLFGSAQMKKWILGTGMRKDANNALNDAIAGQLKFHEVDFSGSTPVFTERVLGNSVNSIVSAGINEGMTNATDDAGNVAFYAFPNVTVPYGTTYDTIYLIAYDSITGKDEVFAKIPPEGQCGNSIKETEIIKREGTTNQYYFIYKTACINWFSNDNWKYVIVDLSTRTITTPVTLQSQSLNEGMAVSNRNCALNNRWLFFVKYAGDNLELYRSSITATTISAPVLVATLPAPNSNNMGGQGDIEISPLSDKLAIANFTNSDSQKDIAILDLDINTGNVSNLRWIDNPGNYIVVLEFSPDGKRLYAFRGGTAAIVSQMLNIPLPLKGNYTVSSSDIINVPIIASHSIEIAYDGRLYFTNNFYNTELYCISNPNADAASNNISTTPANSFGPGNGIGYPLPDQMDGSTIDDNPLAVFVSDSSICKGDSVTIKAIGGTSYQWSGGNTSTASTITVAPLITTSYYIHASNSCNQLVDTITIHVDTTKIKLLSHDTTICKGQTILLTATGATTYQWSGGISSTNASVTITPTGNTIYYLHASNGCEQFYDSLKVTIGTLPITLNIHDTTICKGQTVTLSVKGSTSVVWTGGINSTSPSITVAPSMTTVYYLVAGNECNKLTDSILVHIRTSTIKLNFHDTTICIGASVTITATGGTSYQWTGSTTSTTPSITVSPVANAIYYLTTMNQCGSVKDTVRVKIVTQPLIVLTHDTTVCEGTSVTLAAKGATTYQWSGGVNSTASSVTVTSLVTTQYYLTASNQCKQLKDTITVTIHKLPVAVIPHDTSICNGSAVTLTVKNGVSYVWSGGINATTASITVAPPATTTYSVTVFDGMCYSLKTATTVTVHPNPLVSITGKEKICKGDTITYLATAIGGTSPYHYEWSTGSITASIRFSALINGSLGVVVTDKNGCIGLKSIDITIVPQPKALIADSISGCSPLPVSFVNQSIGATSYIWNLGDGTFSTKINPQHTYADSGKYTVSLIAINTEMCADTIIKKGYVTVKKSPRAAISYTVGINKEFKIYNYSESGDKCVLNFGDGLFLQGCNWKTQVHTYETDGEYTLTQIVLHSNGCADTAQLKILQETEGTLFYPNSFTPDGDGRNDIFYMYGTNVKDFDLRIYNRWGELIFHSINITHGWDGMYKGELVEQDVYVFKVDYKLTKAGSKQVCGHVTVVK